MPVSTQAGNRLDARQPRAAASLVRKTSQTLVLDKYGQDQAPIKRDSTDSLVRTELDKAEKHWAEQEVIEPPLPIGTRIKEGVIAGVCDHMAAHFKAKENGDETEGRFLPVKFEDAVTVQYNA